MKQISIKLSQQKIFIVLAAIIAVFCLISCARSIAFQPSSVVPGAEGSVKVSKDNNKNYNIKIDLSNLAAPNKLEPSKSMYVVWMDTDNNATKNIGKINTSTGMFGGKMKSSFQTVSSIKPTKIFITAEDDAAVQNPGAQVVLSTDIF